MKTFGITLIASIIGSLVALYLAYKYVASQAASSTTGTVVSDISAVANAVKGL